MTETTNKYFSQSFDMVKVYSDGVESPIKKIFTYDAGTVVDVYPDPVRHIRIESNFDTGAKRVADNGIIYGYPVVNLAGSKYENFSFVLSVDVYPKNSEWFLSSATQTVDSQVRSGPATISVDLTSPADGTYYQHSISAIPLYGNVPAQEIRLWTIKPAPSVVQGQYVWNFANNSLVDAASSAELSSVEGAIPTYKIDDDVGNTLVLGYHPEVENDSYEFEYRYAEAEGIDDLDLDTGYTLEYAVKADGSNMQIGYYDPSENEFYAQNFSIRLYWGQPVFNGIGTSDGPKPNTTTANRINDLYTKRFTHLAMTIERVNPDMLLGLDTDGQTSGNFSYRVENQWVSWCDYTSPYTGLSSSIDMRYIRGQFADQHGKVYLTKSYIDGTMIGDSIILVTDDHRSSYKIGDGRFIIRVLNATGLATKPIILAGLNTYKQCLSPGEIEINAIKWTGVTPGSNSQTVTALEAAPRYRRPINIEDTAISASYIKPFIIDNKTIAIGLNFSDFFIDRLQTEYPQLSAQFHNYAYGHCQAYQYELPFTFDLLDLYRDYQPKIRDLVDTESAYAVTGNSVQLLGGWLNSTGLFRDFFSPTKTLVESQVCDINHFAYLRLSSPMVEGTTYSVSWNGQTKSFTYGRDRFCSSIKVNQVGYQPSAKEKYAYVGAWLGTAGTYDLQLEGKPFNIYSGDTIVFSGICKKMPTDDRVLVTDVYHKETGEITYLLDFSAMTTEGTYQIHVPGVGWSHTFKLSNSALGEAFYLHSRCAFHQRANCPKLKPYTNWEYAGVDHPWSFESDFIADDTQYENECVDTTGATYASLFGSKHFQMIPNNKTGRIWRDPIGGWYDAADFDNRPYHLDACNMMLIAYLLAPNNFTDNQLNIPESGNGIPDYLSEIDWNLKLWKSDQRADGGITCWRETDAHESDWPWRSSKEYCFAHPNRKFSLYYAEMAAKLVRCLRIAGTPAALKLATEYATSAIRAFNFGVDPAKTATFTFTQEGHVFTYTENCTNASFTNKLLRAALAMYMMTHDRKYLSYATPQLFATMYKSVNDVEQHYDRHYSYELLFDLNDEFKTESDKLRALVIAKADQWVGYQREHTYKNLNWPKQHWYYNYQLWGVGHLECRGFNIMLAWKLTGDEKYRTCLQLAFDNSMGCNPLGRTQTSGLGKVYPVHFLHHWLNRAEFELGVHEDVPGITPYWCGWNTTGSVTGYAFNIYKDARPADNFDQLNMNLMPRFTGVPQTASRGIVASWLEKQWPMQREHLETTSQFPGISEFTISESCLGKSAIAGVLMGEGYVPTSELKNRKPCTTSKYDVEGFIYLP